MRTLSRNEFVRLVVSGVGGGWLLSACGDDGGDGDSDEGANNGASTGKDGGGNGADAASNGNPATQDSGPIMSQDAGMKDAGSATPDSGMPMKDSGMPPDSGASKMCTTGAKIGTIDLHPHTLTIPAADVTAGAEKTYTIQGKHTHKITLTAMQMAMVKAGTSVIVTSASDATGHTHKMVQIICAP